MSRLIRNAVAIANRVTESLDLQETVTHRPWTGVDDDGDDEHVTEANAVTLSGIVELADRRVSTSGDHEVMSKANVTFLTPVSPNGSSGRKEPFDERDILTLANGITGPILKIEGGLSDPITNRGYFARVFLG